MNKLKPIKWFDLDSSYEQGYVSSGVTPICEYDIYQEDGTASWIVSYYDRQTEEPTKDATGFDSLGAGKEWAWKHYQEKMSFYFTENTDIKYMAWDKYDNVLLDVEELYPPFTASSGKHITVMNRGDLEWRSIDEVVLLEISKLNRGDSDE